MVNEKINKIIASKALCFPSVCINSDTFEFFLFIDINIIYKKTFFFFNSFIQIATEVINTFTIFNSNLSPNINSFNYLAK